MKIGFLHSVKLHLGNIANAKLYRIMYEDWRYDPDHWEIKYYGIHTDRFRLRGLIYDCRSYFDEFKDINEYDLIALSLNFDTYPSDFHKFVRSIINDLYAHFPVLHQKEVIILAGNEVFEKRGSAEKVVRTTWNTAMGILNSVNPNIEVCSWNEKIRTSEEKEAFKEVLDNQQHKSVCKYVGIQLLGTSAENMRRYTLLAQSKGFEVIDVELMTTSYRFSEIKTKFDNDRLLEINKVFIGCPFISEELADYNDMFNKYALSIGDFKKDKFKIIEYVQQFKTFTNSEQEQEVNKMLDEAIMGTIYKRGTRGFIVKLIQKCLNKFIKDYNEKFVMEGEVGLLVEDGLFGAKTQQAVHWFQTEHNLTVDGIVGQNTMTILIKYFLGILK